METWNTANAEGAETRKQALETMNFPTVLQVKPAEGAGVHFPCLPRCPELSLAQKQSLLLTSISVIICLSRMPFYYLPSRMSKFYYMHFPFKKYTSDLFLEIGGCKYNK